MLFDVIIRLLLAVGLISFINANGITTGGVVVSVCVFLILEVSLLCDNKNLCYALTAFSFVIAALFS